MSKPRKFLPQPKELPTPESIDAATLWKTQLVYNTLIEAVGDLKNAKIQPKLKDLDISRHETIVAKVCQRDPPYLEKEELATLMTWKL